jgi:hypothetical protein
MKGLIGAAVAALALTGCIAVPVGAPYPDTYYYPAPAVGVGIYAAPGYRHHHHHHRYHGSRRYY